LVETTVRSRFGFEGLETTQKKQCTTYVGTTYSSLLFSDCASLPQTDPVFHVVVEIMDFLPLGDVLKQQLSPRAT
jgi:hypothetical protein